MLVGVNGICVIGHGRSSPDAVANAIRVAVDLAEQKVIDQLVRAYQRNKAVEMTVTANGGEDKVGADFES